MEKKVMTVAALNLKGGAAKTTTIINLGGVMKESGRRPLLIDLDPQKSAVCWANQGGDRFPFPVAFLEIGKDIKQFRTKLELMVKEHKADIVLIDSPPSLEKESLIAALLSDLVLIPATPSAVDIWAAERALETIKEAQRERGGLPNVAIVPSRLIPGTILAKEIKASLKRFEQPISPCISSRVAMVECCIAGLPINLYAPESRSHKEFKDLMKFVFTNLRK